MSKRAERWMPTDHACRDCGGRIVVVTNSGPTGGGNPLFRCADCGIGAAGMSPDHICWCGFAHKGQGERTYRCVNIAEAVKEPSLKAALLRSGYLPSDPKCRPKVEIAVLNEGTIDFCRKQTEEQKNNS